MANVRARDSAGRAFVLMDEDTSSLRVFFDDVGFEVNAFELSVIIDHDRFAAEPSTMDRPDRRYTVNRVTGELRLEEVRTVFGVTGWQTLPAVGFTAEIGECTRIGRRVDTRCDVEFGIPMLPSAFVPPAEGLAPGIGFGVSDSLRGLVLPEELGEGTDDAVLLDRSKLVTVLFGQPEAIPVTYLTWNLAHWGTEREWNLTGSPFEIVPAESHAIVMAPYDIVGVQEMWSRDDAETLLDAVNVRRAALGLEPVFLYGPASATPSTLESIGGGLTGDPQAGLFIYSRFRAIDSGHYIFTQCKGEDCLKPKGVQWVRLALGEPSAADLSPECVQHDPASNCGPTPTSEMYIDVFNTHMQAGNPELCRLDGKEFTLVMATIAAACPLVPVPGLCETALIGLTSLRLYCEVLSDEAVHASQLQEMGEFIEGVVGESSDQPSIIGGDFNIDGRTLNRSSSSELYYGLMLEELGMLITGADSASPEPSDLLSPFPDAFDWDLDHADVAREEAIYDWTRCGHGTSVGTGDLKDDLPLEEQYRDPLADGMRVDLPGCPQWRCDLPNRYAFDEEGVVFLSGRGDQRLDYILVRPALRPELSDDPPGYMLSRDRSASAVWQPLWPAPIVPGGLPTEHECAAWNGFNAVTMASGAPRNSDHRPVVAHFEFTPLRQPGRFHPGWNHQVSSRVTSVDVTNVPDCALNVCGPADPLMMLEGYAVRPDGTVEDAPGTNTTSSCDNRNEGSLSWPLDACMNGWATGPHEAPAGVYDRHEFAWKLFESDDTSPTDELATVDPPTHPNFRVLWSSSEFDVDTLGIEGSDPNDWAGPTPILSSDPFRWCTRIESPNFCTQITVEEVE